MLQFCPKLWTKIEAIYVHLPLTDLPCQDLHLQGKRGFAIKTVSFVHNSGELLTFYIVPLTQMQNIWHKFSGFSSLFWKLTW